MKNRKPNRWKGYDYSEDNLYFVTACVHNRICCFGEIINGKMILNQYGEIAEKQWYWLALQYDYVVLHEFVVMPNHIHGIIEIHRDSSVGTGRDLSLQRDLSVRDISVDNGTGRDLSLPKIKSLSELMGAYKTTSSKQIHLLNIENAKEFQWQRSFYDHIIRNDGSYDKIADYIFNNPSKWEMDTFYA